MKILHSFVIQSGYIASLHPPPLKVKNARGSLHVNLNTTCKQILHVMDNFKNYDNFLHIHNH